MDNKSCFNQREFEKIFDDRDDDAKRGAIVQMARTCEAAERYQDMCKFMKYLVEFLKETGSGKDANLTIEERNLLSVAYKNVIGTRRASWRTLMAEKDTVDTNTAKKSDMLGAYCDLVSSELKDVCNEVLKVLDSVIKMAVDTEESVFYLKMAGDYHRYLAETFPNDDSYAEELKHFYQQAYEKASEEGEDNDGKPRGLKVTHPIRLGLALNYSVAYFEILKNKQKACEMAKQAFDDAISKLDKLEEADYKDSTLIMQLLRDNLTLWTASEDQHDEDTRVEDLSEEDVL